MRKVGPRPYEVQTESGTYRRNRQHLRLQDCVTSPEGNSNEEEPEEPETMEEGNTQKERAEEDPGGSQESSIQEPALRLLREQGEDHSASMITRCSFTNAIDNNKNSYDLFLPAAG